MTEMDLRQRPHRVWWLEMLAMLALWAVAIMLWWQVGLRLEAHDKRVHRDVVGNLTRGQNARLDALGRRVTALEKR